MNEFSDRNQAAGAASSYQPFSLFGKRVCLENCAITDRWRGAVIDVDENCS